MRRWLSEGIVLRVVEFGESDRIVRVLTPDSGRLTAIAKGARRSVKRFPGTLDLFNHVRVQVERRRRSSMARLEQGTLISPYLGLRRDPTRFALGCYLIELLDRLAPEGGLTSETVALFRFARDALGAIERAEPNGPLRVWVELRALDALGLRPQLRNCVRCGAEARAPGPVGFHVAEGGVVCGGCSARLDGLLPVHLGTLRALERGLEFDLERLGRVSLGASALAEALRVIGRFQRFHVGVELQSERFLDARLRP